MKILYLPNAVIPFDRIDNIFIDMETVLSNKISGFKALFTVPKEGDILTRTYYFIVVETKNRTTIRYGEFETDLEALVFLKERVEDW